GTGLLRNRMQAAVARMAECLIEVASGAGELRKERLDELALLSCREAAGFFFLLKAASGMSEEKQTQFRLLLTQLIQMLIQRVQQHHRHRKHAARIGVGPESAPVDSKPALTSTQEASDSPRRS